MGVLANRENKVDESIRLLKPLVTARKQILREEQLHWGLRTLADNYAKSYRYGNAADSYGLLLQKLGRSISDAERQDIEGSRALMELLRHAPQQRVICPGAFAIRTSRNAVGLIEAPITVGTATQPWILDTGANLSVVTVSLARRLGLTLSAGTAPVAGLGGTRALCHTAVIPKLRIGKAELRNVAVMVIDDKDLYIEPIKFQMEALLGAPALFGLGEITFSADGRFGVDPGEPRAQAGGDRMFLDEMTPVVAVPLPGGIRLCTLDTGAVNTYMNNRYWRDHRQEFAGQQLTSIEIGGSGGTRSIAAYTAPLLAFQLGGVPVELRDVPILTEPRTTKEYFYANLGQDVLSQLKSYSLDLRVMRFSANRDLPLPVR